MWVYRMKKDSKQAAVVKRYLYECASFGKDLLSAFQIETQKDSAELHPPMFCTNCYLTMKRKIAANQRQAPYKCRLEPYDWSSHTMQTCKVPQIYMYTCDLVHNQSIPHHWDANLFSRHDGLHMQHQTDWVTLQQKLWNT